MTPNQFSKLFHFFKQMVCGPVSDVFTYQPSAHLIENCGGVELELHPQGLMWGDEIAALAIMAERMACSLELRFYDGSIIIR